MSGSKCARSSLRRPPLLTDLEILLRPVPRRCSRILGRRGLHLVAAETEPHPPQFS